MGITTKQFGPYAKGSRPTTAELDENFNYLDETKTPHVTAATGTQISFANTQIYNLPSNPGEGNLTVSLANARLGIVQKIYHQDSVEPNFPAGWTAVGSGEYVTDELNIIYAEWAGGTRVEYWITG